MRLDKWLMLGAIALLVAAAIAAMVLAKREENLIKVDRSKTETGRWIVYSKSGLIQKPGVRAFSVPGGKTLEGLNAAVFDKEPVSIKSSDVVIQKEYVHHIFPFSCSRCESIECPGTAPTPSPTPTPTPVEEDRSWGRARVKAKEAMKLVDTSKVRVGIVDTGLDVNHECVGNVVATKSFTGEPVTPDTGQHGSHVAGTVAGKCGVGISRAGIVFGKGLMNNGSGSSSQLAQAVAWVCSQAISVASFSWGSPQQDGLINQAISECTRKGIAVVIANGNDGQGQINWPARLSQTNPLVFAIAASDQSDRKASFSSYGPGTKFIAPGVDIVSNKPGGGFQKMSGTSMSCPTVAGLMAYCAAQKKPFQSCLKGTTQISGYLLPDAMDSIK